LCISFIVSILCVSTTAVFFIKLVSPPTGPPIELPRSPALLLNVVVDVPTICLTSIVPGDFVKVYRFIVLVRLPSLGPCDLSKLLMLFYRSTTVVVKKF
jgi:hypothetical protein